MSNEMEEFARLLVENVRDCAIRNCDGLSRPDAGSPAAKRWRQAATDSEKLQAVISDVVDETIFSFLQAIDEGSLKLKFVTHAGKEIDLSAVGLGELGGWYMGSGGWRAKFSNERYVDDFADIAAQRSPFNAS